MYPPHSTKGRRVVDDDLTATTMAADALAPTMTDENLYVLTRAVLALAHEVAELRLSVEAAR